MVTDANTGLVHVEDVGACLRRDEAFKPETRKNNKHVATVFVAGMAAAMKRSGYNADVYQQCYDKFCPWRLGLTAGKCCFASHRGAIFAVRQGCREGSQISA